MLSMLIIYFYAFVIGCLTELVANHFRFWIYRKRAFLAFNILVPFTLIQGSLAYFSLLGGYENLPARLFLSALLGSCFGLLYELNNEFFCRLFDFDRGGIGPLRKKWQLIVGVGIAWGGIPLMAVGGYLLINEGIGL